MRKRYQYISAEGIKFTRWFHIDEKAPRPKWQMIRGRTKLKNEYKKDEKV